MENILSYETAGQYYLKGVPEMASGFKLDKDHSFQFFLSYGALDRHGEGKWRGNMKQLVFDSKPWSGKDFALLNSKTEPGDLITIRIVDNNEQILRYVLASLGTEMKGNWEPANQEEIIKLPKQAVTNISLVFEFCQERFSIFSIAHPEHNYFEFRLEPWLVEFFFKDFHLERTATGLKGKHPMLIGEEFVYEKQR